MKIGIIVILAFLATQCAAEKMFYWSKSNVQPFGTRSVERGIMKFDIPNEVKIAFLSSISFPIEDKKNFIMKEGEELDEMLFGDYKVVKNVIVKLPLNQRGAKVYCMYVSDNYKYFFIKPIACSNWAWWKEKIIIIIEEEKVAKKIEKKIFIIPEVEILEEVEEKKVEIMEEVEEKKAGIKIESYLWEGSIMGKNQDPNIYVGGNCNIFFRGDITTELGIGSVMNFWENGHKISVGPVFKKNSKEFTIQIGKNFVLFGLFGNLSDETNFWVNVIKKQTKKASYYDIGCRHEIWLLNERMKVGILWKSSYAEGDCSFGKAVGLFVTDKKFSYNLELRNVSNSKYENSNGSVVIFGIDYKLIP